MSLGNIQSSIRNTPSMHAWIPIALLPICPKRVNKIPGYSADTQEVQALQTVHDVLKHLLKPLSDASCQEGYEMVCADGKVRLCFPKLFCWLADHPENATLHGVANNRCPICTSPTDKLGDYSETVYPNRSHTEYAQAYKNSDAASLNADGIKNINNALWSMPNLQPPDLVRADILHNILLGVLDHLMDWIQGFLEHHERILAFDYVWRRLPPYPGFSVPTKAYRVVSQWSGKEMRNFGKVILGAFTAALRRTTNQARPTWAQLQEFNKAIRCERNITDFCLLTQNPSHTDQTISYLQKYLRVFHETKDVFLRFRAGKKSKQAAAEAHKNLLKEQQTQKASLHTLPASEKAKLRQENTLERQELVDEILREGAHYNFPKIQLISHYAQQIPKFGALSQYSTEISETMHKGFKEAYCRSNKVDATSQIVTTYTRDHTFAMKDMTISTWTQIKKDGNLTQSVGKQPTINQVYIKLQGKIDLGTVSTLADLEVVAGLCDLKVATRVFLTRELKGANSDVMSLLAQGIRGYRSLQIPVPKLNGHGFVLHHARCTGLDDFRGQKRSDWIWIRKHAASFRSQPGSLNGRIPGKLNALFKLTGIGETVYRLAHVTLLQCLRESRQGEEGMPRVRLSTAIEGVVVPIATIEGMVHLIPLEPGESWLVNNRIDPETWNTVYD